MALYESELKKYDTSTNDRLKIEARYFAMRSITADKRMNQMVQTEDDVKKGRPARLLSQICAENLVKAVEEIPNGENILLGVASHERGLIAHGDIELKPDQEMVLEAVS